MKLALDHFEQCADEAPEGTYVQAKQVRTLIGETANRLIKEVRELGLQSNTCDEIRKVEVAIYAYVKASNPDAAIFATAEGFGKSMEGPARERVIGQALADRDFFSGRVPCA